MGYIMETRLIERRFTNKLVYAYARTRSHLHAIVARLVIRWLLGIWPSFPAKLLPIERDPRRRDSLSLSRAIPIAFGSIFRTIEFPHAHEKSDKGGGGAREESARGGVTTRVEAERGSRWSSGGSRANKRLPPVRAIGVDNYD